MQDWREKAHDLICTLRLALGTSERSRDIRITLDAFERDGA
jgi:hypothetical protein